MTLKYLRADVIAGVVVWSVVVPQCAAYAQIAGLPPQAGLMAAPGALIAYALLGTSRSLVVSATTATSAMSAAAVGPLAHGDMAAFAALSAALAILAGVVLVAGGFLGLGAISDFVSAPVMTGLMFGLGLTIAVGQAPKLLGVQAGSGNFFPRLLDLLQHLGDTHVTTLVVGLASIAIMLLTPRTIAPIVTLAAATAASGLLSLDVAVVGKLPDALPQLAFPHTHEWLSLLPAAFGVLVLSTEAVGVARTLAQAHHYDVDVNRDLSAMGASNIVAGLSSGFVQSGGASQTAAADSAGGRTQLATLVAAGLLLLTGAFLTGIFRDLPQATLAAIVVAAVRGFYRVGELRRYARVRRSALLLALLALAGVLLIGVLPGLLLAAAISLILVLRRLSRPQIEVVAEQPLTLRVDGALFYGNAVAVKEQVLELAKGHDTVILNLVSSWDLDIQTLDMLEELRAAGIEFTRVRPGAARMLRESSRPSEETSPTAR
jgi:SulP family sulfate permease